MPVQTGKIAQVIGPVIDVRFEGGATLPNILDALEVIKPNGQKIILEIKEARKRIKKGEFYTEDEAKKILGL